MDQHLWDFFIDQTKTGRFTFMEPCEAKHYDYAHSLYLGYLEKGENTPALLVLNPVSAYRLIHEMSDELKSRVVLFDLNDRTTITPINFLSPNIGSIRDRQNFLTEAVKAELHDKNAMFPDRPLDWKQDEALNCAIAAICHINDKRKLDHLVGPSLLPFLLKMSLENAENFANHFMTEPDEKAISMYYQKSVKEYSTEEHRSVSELVDKAINCFGNQSVMPLISSPYEGFSPREAIDNGNIVIVIPNLSNFFDRLFVQWIVIAYCEYLGSLTDPFLYVCEGFEHFYEMKWSQLLAPRDNIRTAITIDELSQFETNQEAMFIRGLNHLVSIMFKPDLIKEPWVRTFIPEQEERLGTDVEIFFHDWWFTEITDPGVYVQTWEKLSSGKRIFFENIPGYTRSLLNFSQSVSASSLESSILISQKQITDLTEKSPINKKAGRMLKVFFSEK